MNNSEPIRPFRRPFSKFQIIFTAIVIVTLTAVNLWAVFRNISLAQDYDAIALQSQYLENCQLVSEYLPELAPPLIRYQNQGGEEELYYCYRITISGPQDPDYDNTWYLCKSDNNYNSEEVILPDYSEVADQTFYHTYTRSSSGTEYYYLETYRVHELNGFYHEIECTYERIDSRVDINDPDSIASFLLHQDPPSLTVQDLTIAHPSPDQTVAISHDDDSVLYLPGELKELSPCGCVNCCCDKCTCTG